MEFYTTKFAEAEDKKEAELKAVDLIKQDKDLLNIVLNKEREIDVIPIIYLEEIYEISKQEMKKNQGRAWYTMNNEN